MQLHRLLCSIFASLLCCTPCMATPFHQSLAKKRAIADLDSIHNIFEVKYAPKQWKQEYANWDLTQAIEEAKNKIESLPSLSTKACQVVLRDFFNSTKDYHVGVRFFSTESATLPFLIKGAEGRYFFSYIDRIYLSRLDFPFEVGDEILTFGGAPVHEVVQNLRVREFGSNVFETDQALAEMTLTHRRGTLGHIIPSGQVEVTGKQKGSEEPITTVLTWYYSPEKIREFSKLGAHVGYDSLEQAWDEDYRSVLKNSGFFKKMMVAHHWDKSYVGAFTQLNKHAIGARTSFIPSLGKKVWKTGDEMVFDAYIFQSPSGKKIGYIRLPHYIGEEEELEEFGSIMNYFQKRTEALVIDQVNNPGGSVFYLYALASTLANSPMATPKHHMAMTQEEVYIADLLLPYLEQVNSNETARVVLGDTMEGYPIDYEFVKLMKQFCHFLISQWESGKLYTDPTFLFGVDHVKPHPQYRYTKPILVLINSLDFSCGDFFPAILQDNKRATILGTRTSGAGGYVLQTMYPNHSGMSSFALTGSLAERINKEPIENLGVQPDIKYELTVSDLQNDYQEYVNKIVETVEALANNS